MMSVTDPALCRRVAVRHSLGLVAVCTAAPLLGVTDWTFALDSLPLNLYMVLLSWRFHQQPDSTTSRKLFRYTLVPSLLHSDCIVVSFLDPPSVTDDTDGAGEGLRREGAADITL